jgi:hypothetical protein
VSMPTTRTHPSVAGTRVPQIALSLSLSLLVLFSAGCASQRRPKFRMTNLALAHPIVPIAVPDNSPATAPDLEITAPMPPTLAVVRVAPARPRVIPPPTSPPASPAKPPEPIMTPELSTEELSAAKGETQQNLTVTDRNLALTKGKRLSSSQNDLVSQVRGFADSAREAVRDGDWSRARDLAKKAAVLSQELASSL